MPRTLTSDMIAALSAAVVRPIIFVEAEFADNTARYWTGLGDRDWNGHTWVGAGELGEISAISEDSAIIAKGITLTLNGIPSALLTEVLSELRITRGCTVWLALLNEDGSLVDTPVVSYAGVIDQPEIQDGADTCSVKINCENVLVDFNRSVWRRYTNDDQQLDYPGDTGFQFVQAIQEITVYWGTVPGAYNQ